LKSSAKNIKLTSYDEIFQTEEEKKDAERERVQEIPLSELYPFKDHPFQVRDDDSMKDTTESIRKYGVLVPAIARSRPEGGYELIAGHRRKHACELAGKETMPVIVRELDDDAATIIMVDSNLQRENILPSERALAYKMKLEALKHQGQRTDLTSEQVVPKLPARNQIAKESGESGMQVSRYIRLTELSPELL
jgi:ParB family chromosome partitioning protein